MNHAVGRLCLAGVFLASPVFAHHSPAAFDLSQNLILEGTVREYSFRNPHVYFQVDVAGAGGTSLTYLVEAGGAANMTALGFGADAVAIGERIVVQVKPNRDPANLSVLGWLLSKADGTEIPLHVRAMPATVAGDAEADSIAGTWVPQGVGFAELAVAARSWPLSEAGLAAVEATREAREVSRSSCIPFGPPGLMALPSTISIEVSATEVRFRLDVMGAERIVHLDVSEHPPDLEPSLHGYSIGRFDGDTLVVDTMGFADHPDGFAFDLPSSAAKRIIERFTLAADRKHIEYVAFVDDREILSVPVTHRSRWDYRPGQQPSNVPCDDESSGRFTEDF